MGLNGTTSYQFRHYLESTGGPFLVIRASERQSARVLAGELLEPGGLGFQDPTEHVGERQLLVDSESGHLLMLEGKHSSATALVEAVYASDDWWLAVSRGAEVELKQGNKVGGLSAGLYLVGDVFAVASQHREFEAESTLDHPAAIASLLVADDIDLFEAAANPDDDTLLSGLVLLPRNPTS